MSSSANEILRVEDGIRFKFTTLLTSGAIPRRVCIIKADATGGAFTLTLPSAALNSGQFFMVKKTDSTSAVVTVQGDTAGPDLIDGRASVALTVQHQSITLYSDGTNWMNATPISSAVFDSVLIQQPVDTSGTPTPAETIVGGAHTGVLLEANDVNLNFARTVTFADGAALSTQRAMLIQAPTYASAIAKVIATAATLAISGAPSAGANVTLTSTRALWIQAGTSQFDGGITGTDTAANTVGIRNGTAPQILSVYNTYTAGTPDFERVELKFASSIATLNSVANGTGTLRALNLCVSSAVLVNLSAGFALTLGLATTSSTASFTMTTLQGSFSGVSGTRTTAAISGTYSDGAVTSTAVISTLSIIPTVNYTAASKTGKVVLANFAPTLTSLPSGNNAAMSFSSVFTNTMPVMTAYNTADEVTNWERSEMFWFGNAFYFRINTGGSGTARVMNFPFNGGVTVAIQVPAATTDTLTLHNATLSTAIANGRVIVGNASCTATSGTHIGLSATETFSPSATSTMVGYGLRVNPTINYSNGTPGAGYVQCVRIAPVNTALPTGRSSGLNLASTASGLTAALSFENQTDDQTNFESLTMGFASNVFTMASVKGGTGTVRDIRLAIGGVNKIRLDANANVILNDSGSALATGAVNGFVYVNNCAGTPSGVPASLPTGATPMMYDTTANKIWFYNGSWRGVLVA